MAQELPILKQIPISQINPYMNSNFSVIGIVVQVCDIHVFAQKREQNERIGVVVNEDNSITSGFEDSSTKRAVFSFTLKDQPMASIEFKFWGDIDLAVKLKDIIKIGCAVKISKPKIVQKPFVANGQFSPMTHSSSQLLFTPTTYLALAPTKNKEQLMLLMRVPPSSDYFTVNDVIMDDSGELNNCEVNLLAVVAQIHPTKKSFSTKLDKDIVRTEVLLCDDLVNRLTLVIWGASLSQYVSEKLQVGTSVFLCPVRLRFDSFRGGQLVASTLGKTILTVDPVLDDAQHLQRAVKEMGIVETVQGLNERAKENGNSYSAKPNISLINDVYCVGEVCLLLNNDNLDDENLPLPLTGKVTATLTKFDIDLIGRHPLVKVCQVCRSWITQLQMVFPDSPEDQSLDFCNKCLKSVQTEYLYWVRACLSDHSGSVECKINSQVCMELLGVPPEEFKMLPMHGRTLLKWKVLLETFDAYFSLYKTQNGSLGMRLLKLDSVRSAHDN